MPKFEFCRPTARKVVPDGPDWIHEVKYDGYRGRLIRAGSEVKLPVEGWTGLDLALPWIVETAKKMKQTHFVVDGEICVLDLQGISDFNALHTQAGTMRRLSSMPSTSSSSMAQTSATSCCRRANASSPSC
ncbi:ATP-dependent DNA ligase [Bradyrhizobium diazoefficiens]|uniref:ATP-dependent DNA ligase n=1 Tax=Bradyrhizobium diazoefficiens TaxID=1355477 RepID=UPI0034970F0F